MIVPITEEVAMVEVGRYLLMEALEITYEIEISEKPRLQK